MHKDIDQIEYLENKLSRKLIDLEEQHLKNLDKIGKSKLFSSHGHVFDEAGTNEMHQENTEFEIAQYAATRNGIQAFERLMHLAETRRSGQIQSIAQFLAGVWGADPGLKLESLKGVDKSIGDDMVAVLNAIRWNQMPVLNLGIDSRNRVPAALRSWGYKDL